MKSLHTWKIRQILVILSSVPSTAGHLELHSIEHMQSVLVGRNLLHGLLHARFNQFLNLDWEMSEKTNLLPFTHIEFVIVDKA